MRRVFSGIQPSGMPHVGNYFGAISHWVKLQNAAANAERSRHMFCIVDLHAMTSLYDARTFPASCRTTAAILLGCGLDPSKVIVFKQSEVREHTELAWILGCVTPLGWLNRMTQFKSKAGAGRNAQESAVLGLYSYPVLQAADVLLYQGTEVPVGEDQLQHIELMRDIAAAFNRRFCSAPPSSPADAAAAGAAPPALPPLPTPPRAFSFALPQAVSLAGSGAAGAGRIMSLRDGGKKMSKSDASDAGRINLSDSDEAIRDKVRRAKTDSEAGFSFEPARRPDKSNLLALYAAATGARMEETVARFADAPAAAFKEELADALIALLRPMRSETARLLAEPAHLDAVLADGAAAAREIACETMAGVRDVTGLAASS